MTVTLNAESIGGELVGSLHGTARTYPKGRVCEHKGCRTVLSMYNSGSACAVHAVSTGLGLVVRSHPATVHRSRTAHTAHVGHRAA